MDNLSCIYRILNMGLALNPDGDGLEFGVKVQIFWDAVLIDDNNLSALAPATRSFGFSVWADSLKCLLKIYDF